MTDSNAGLPTREKEANKKILLVPVGKIDPAIVEFLAAHLGRVFGKAVAIAKALGEPRYAFEPMRQQYRSTTILKDLMRNKEFSEYEKVLGIVDHDLYVPELNFVFGEASDRTALISLTRLRQEFYGFPEDRGLFEKRTLTEAVHELGHTYGLGHCRHSSCVMFFSNSILDTDRKGFELCAVCQREMQKKR